MTVKTQFDFTRDAFMDTEEALSEGKLKKASRAAAKLIAEAKRLKKVIEEGTR